MKFQNIELTVHSNTSWKFLKIGIHNSQYQHPVEHSP
jgi:hypothetical protein